MRTQSRVSKPPKTSKLGDRRRSPRHSVKLLTAFRSLDPAAPIQTGFVRALHLSTTGVLLESPDPFTIGESLALEFLLNNDRIAQATGTVMRINKKHPFYHVAVTFDKLAARTKRLILEQIKK